MRGGCMSYTVEYYERSDGTRPAEEFILSQDNKMQAKLFMTLEFLEDKGPLLREPYSKSLGDGILKFGPNKALTSAASSTSSS